MGGVVYMKNHKIILGIVLFLSVTIAGMAIYTNFNINQRIEMRIEKESELKDDVHEEVYKLCTKQIEKYLNE